MKQFLAEAKLADEVGLDVYAVGEHHRADYMISSPAVLLAAVAAQTERIRLTSAVTVLSSEDPVRVWQQFAELDLISGGRAEIIAGRGSFTESFPLFGYDLKDYEELFAEKLDLLLRLQDGGPIVWEGRHRPSLAADDVHPHPVQHPLPIWIAVGGTPSSIERAGRLRLPLALAIIGGRVSSFAGHVQLYRSSGGEGLPLALQMHGFVASSSTEANSRFAPGQLEVMNRIGRERGWRPIGNEQYLEMTRGDGAIVVGSP
ncbi:MAG: LLM class flavin-dependent oxidoreductase, partial [Actinobacteria bacterium]|nr:LLM class flavin-dependent oxidoreductase [Actinomycetota bacterium]